MKIKIWEKNDYFQFVRGSRIDMDPSVVELPQLEERIPLFWHFDREAIPKGWVTDIRLEDGEIVGEVTFTDDGFKNLWESIKDLSRFGGFYTHSETNEAGNQVLKCKLEEASMVLKANMPGAT